MATQTVPASDQKSPQNAPAAKDWTKPAAMAIPKEGYFTVNKDDMVPPSRDARILRVFSRRQSHAWPGTDIRDYGNNIEDTVAGPPDALDALKLHYFRWVLFDIGTGPTSCIRVSSTPISTSTPRTLWRFSSNTV